MKKLGIGYLVVVILLSVATHKIMKEVTYKEIQNKIEIGEM